jgi:hypothetical protein
MGLPGPWHNPWPLQIDPDFPSFVDYFPPQASDLLPFRIKKGEGRRIDLKGTGPKGKGPDFLLLLESTLQDVRSRVHVVVMEEERAESCHDRPNLSSGGRRGNWRNENCIDLLPLKRRRSGPILLGSERIVLRAS